MKKILLLLLLVLFTLSIGANENWIYSGFEYSKIFETASFEGIGSERELSSIGANISGYSFSDFSSGGFFFHSSILFPYHMKLTNGDEVISLGRKDVVYNYLFSLMAGPAFKTSSNRVMQMYGGLGLHGSALLVGMGSAYYGEYVSQKTFNVGVGMDLAGKVNFTPNFYFSLGAMGVWDFYNYTELRVNGYSAETEFDKFRTFVINPFACFGFSWES
ncbi:hypothetical protein [Oceanispirochaeta sp.]|jgi:hypothetical protein|uniref:hypothetical protein n=1 Tax=Oceanispirochaeta sp. TaxID=2035350 RepID=UPI00262938A3|nr:hypothetical protein [Oceanispirochaeta sp.]MDA3956091.1 hypothetical protein [Oceanispirochaeta sp.]